MTEGWFVIDQFGDLSADGERMMLDHFTVQCPECGRVFDLTDHFDADEFYNGHDCEDE